MKIDFLALCHSIKNNVKQTRAWLIANSNTENIFNLLFTYSDLEHLMIDDDQAKGQEGKTCRPDSPKKSPAGKSHRPDSSMNSTESQVDPAVILYFRESCTEFINSFKLAESSFYRYAFAALRNALDAGIMSVASKEADDVMHSSGSPGPVLQQLQAREIIGKLYKITNVKHFCKKSDIIEKCRKLHQELSALSGGKDFASGLVHNVPTLSAGFDEKVFILWTVCLRKTIRMLFNLFILKYPVAILNTPLEKKISPGFRGGPFLNSEERESLIELLDGDDLDILMEISKKDPYALKQAAEVNSCPDIVEEELSRQLKGLKEELKKNSSG